ncbi:MAG: hypothetical protein IID48_14670 [Proteobacteria bacterium]|nr:hypothetical protein [Pseudomonadota bacterium]
MVAEPDTAAPEIAAPAPEFEIVGADGAEQHGSNGRVTLTVYPDGQSRLRKRNAIKNACTARARKVQWLYGELDGVRAYLHDDGRNVHVILTKRDLYP